MNPKILGVVLVIAAALLWMRSSVEEAPLASGSFLSYESGSTIIRVTFSQSDGDEFTTRLEMIAGEGQIFTLVASNISGIGL